MKSVLFHCLLIFSVFKVVCSDKLMDQLNELHANTLQRINNIANVILVEIQNDVNAAIINGKNVQQCYKSAATSMKKYVNSTISLLDTCREEAARLNFLQYAKRCNSGAVSLFKEDAKRINSSTQICIA